jgi:hypothetical protein
MAYRGRVTLGGNYAEFVSDTIKQEIEVVQDEGIRGTRSRVMERLVLGNVKVGGNMVFNPTPVEMAFLLPLVTGSSTTATVLTDALADVTVIKDSGTVTDTFIGRMSKYTFEFEPGEKVKLTADFVGKSRSVGAGGSLSTAPDITVAPYFTAQMGSGITIGGTVYQIAKATLSIDNKISPTYMAQSTTATDLEPTDRIVMLELETKYNAAENALLILNEAGPIIGSALTASLALTNGANSMTFTFGALVAPPETITIPNRAAKLRLPLRFQCYKVGTTLEVVPVLV